MNTPSIPILYTQDGCADSARVRQWLTDRDIAFIERNVTGDPRAAADLAATGTFATPLLVAGETKIVGFIPAALTETLERASS